MRSKLNHNNNIFATTTLPPWINSEKDFRKIIWSLKNPNIIIIKCSSWGDNNTTIHCKENNKDENKIIDNKEEKEIILFSNDELMITHNNMELNNLKGMLDSIPEDFKFGKRSLYTIIRNVTNPFEGVGNLHNKFQNRSAVKLMEMNFILNDFLKNFFSQHDKKDKIRILDLCGAPGGFTEFCFSHLANLDKSGEAMGISLNNTNNRSLDWNLKRINNVATLTMTADKDSGNNQDRDQHDNSRKSERIFYPFYGCYRNGGGNTGENVSENVGGNGNGDITCPEILESIIKKIETNYFDAIFADGGFSVEGDENNQEIRHTQLILAEFLIGILASQTKGLFICKIYDQQNQLNKYLTLLTTQFFDHFIIYKPSQSRPASSERYMIFINRKPRQSNNHQQEEKILQWMLALHISLYKNIMMSNRKQEMKMKVKTGFGGHCDDVNSYAKDKNDNDNVTISVLQDVLKTIPFKLPILSVSPNETQWDQWNYICKSQKKSECLQIEYLTILHEMMGLFGNLYPLLLNQPRILNNLNNIIQFQFNDDSKKQQENLIAGAPLLNAKNICQLKIKQWMGN